MNIGLIAVSYTHLDVYKRQLLQIRGVGEVKAIQLQCIGELSKRMAAAGARKGLCFHDPASIADYYMERLRHEDQEVLLCMMLDLSLIHI